MSQHLKIVRVPTARPNLGIKNGKNVFLQQLKAKDLRGKTKEELATELTSIRKELLDMRLKKVLGSQQDGKFQKIGLLRKSVARVLTVMNQTQREHLKV